MRISVIHGEEESLSSKRLEELVKAARAKGQEVRRIDAYSGTSLRELMSSVSLFGEKTLLVISEPSRFSRKDFDWLSREDKKDGGELVLFSKGLLRKDFIRKLPHGAKIEEFKPPENIFKFLDSFFPGNAGKSIQILHTLARNEPLEKIGHFLGRHLRDLYWVGIDPKLLPYSQDWRILKLSAQSKKFRKGQIEAIIADLAEADIASKTSDSGMLGLLDQIIATQLE